MPNELNPCEMCGASPRRSKERMGVRCTYTVYCPVCGNEIEDAKHTPESADAAWNAARKEQP